MQRPSTNPSSAPGPKVTVPKKYKYLLLFQQKSLLLLEVMRQFKNLIKTFVWTAKCIYICHRSKHSAINARGATIPSNTSLVP